MSVVTECKHQYESSNSSDGSRPRPHGLSMCSPTPSSLWRRSPPPPAAHLFIRLEDVLRGHGADSGAQGLDHGVGHLHAHPGRVGVQDTEVALVTLHHQVQGAPLGIHSSGVRALLRTPPPPPAGIQSGGDDVVSLQGETYNFFCFGLGYLMSQA